MNGLLDRNVRKVIVGAAVGATGVLLVLPAPATAVEPVAGAATVDGSPAEWTPADDVAPLVGNDPPHLERGRVSLRYDCADEVLYALVMAGPGLRLEANDADEAYLRLGDDPKLVSGTDDADGDAPDAAWVDRRDGSAAGIEMSAPLPSGTDDELRVHAKLPDDSEDGYETLDLAPRLQRLAVTCAADTAVAEVGLGADPGSDPEVAVEGSDLARTGAPLLPVLVAAGVLLVVGGAALRLRRWGRPAAP